MSRKTREILFYSSVTIFVLLSAVVLVLALGYRYDFIRNKFVKTGSLRLTVNTDASVYINDQLSGATSFLSNSFTKKFLLPRTYDVRIEKSGYFSWQKHIEVEAGIFGDFSSIVILPKKLTEENVEKKFEFPVDKTTKSPDDAKNLIFNKHEIWVEWLKDADYQPFKKSGEKELIARFSPQVYDVQWHKDSNHLFANVGGILKFIEIDTRDNVNIFDLSSAGDSFYYDKDSDAVYKIQNKKLYKLLLK